MLKESSQEKAANKNSVPEIEAEVPDVHEEEGPARSRALLAVLRNNEQYSDAVIVVEDHEFPVHRAIVARLSKFFSNAFSRGFSEAKNRKLVIGEASAAAMSTVLDFAYGIDVGSVLRQNSDYAFEVWELAHRLQISSLTKIAGAAVVEYASIENSVRIFIQANLFDCKQESGRMFLYIAQRFKHVYEQCADFSRLQAHEIRDWLKSKELIASEFEKYTAIKKWVMSAGAESRECHLSDLMVYVRFELLDRFCISTVLDDLDFLPKKVLSEVLQRSLCTGLLIPGLDSRDENTYGRKRSACSGADFALTIGKLESEVLLKPMAPFFFTYQHWVISAGVELRGNVLYLRLQFEQRFSSEGPLVSLTKDVSSFSFRVSTRLVTEKGAVCNAKTYYNLVSADNSLRLNIIESSNLDKLKTSYGEEKRGNLSLLVSLVNHTSQKNQEGQSPGYDDGYY